jgi:phosphoglycerate dehydrogenase-like enzyme
MHARKTRAQGDIMSEARAKGQVGIIGLGIMGGAIAKNLSAAGWQVIGLDYRPKPLAPRRYAGRLSRSRREMRPGSP